MYILDWIIIDAHTDYLWELQLVDPASFIALIKALINVQLTKHGLAKWGKMGHKVYKLIYSKWDH